MGEQDKTERDERLRTALRENLRRRKAQARGRKAQDEVDAPAVGAEQTQAPKSDN